VTTRCAGQELAVVAHVQHALGRLVETLLQPPLAGHVEEVVRLVQQQHLVRAAQQQLQREPLLLAARQRADRPVAHLLPGQPERRDGRGVERHLGLVPARLAPRGERLGVAQLGALALVEGPLGGAQPLPGGADRLRGERQGEVGEGGAVGDRADELAHHPEPAAAGDAPGGRGELARDHPQQRGLARPVRPDERDLRAVRDPERHVGEQRAPVRQPVLDAHRLDVSHAAMVAAAPRAGRGVFRRAAAAGARPRR
jgi:hypothetical protein